jgi:hypothetical protein
MIRARSTGCPVALTDWARMVGEERAGPQPSRTILSRSFIVWLVQRPTELLSGANDFIQFHLQAALALLSSVLQNSVCLSCICEESYPA